MNTFFSLWRRFSRISNLKLHVLLCISAMLFTFLVNPVFSQTEVDNLAVVVNALDYDDWDITSSLSIIDLDEPNLKRAIDDEVVVIGDVPSGMLIHGHLAYITRFKPFSDILNDGILIVNLEQREAIGHIPIELGAYPQQMALVSSNKMYVTCDNAHQVHVVNLDSRRVTKIITDPSFNKTTGITILNGKAYVTNPAWEWDAAAGRSIYHQSSVTVIDTQTDTVLKSIPTPINTTGIVNDGDSTVIAKTTGDYNMISGSLILIDTTTDEIITTVNTRTTPGSIAINAQKQLFIQGGWQHPGLLIYDVPNQKWIRDRNDTLTEFAGGSGMVFGPDGNLYIAKPDWTQSGLSTLLVMAPDETLLKTYDLGYGTDKVAVVQLMPRNEDTNDDGFVDIKDLIIVSRDFGQRGPGITGDVNRDGVVNILDLILVSRHF
ncbi:hypothetical protein F4083_09695 [Candidatus Poribacteria bacterium]|nr:hypothetical protein [Candidatus Poribacteria bacterium]MYB66136.1 hypothetical protein [Candidatus Poribacteria bacterium]MYF54597.1 hypothetical protein [Candidatus Poribacteria bacterium]MYI94575.1 hypothetical protein [Candidatus Poribacteria bacterium]